MARPILFTITETGKQTALNAATDAAALKINLIEVGLGAGKYTPTGNETKLASELQRRSIVSGDVELASHTLRFSSSMTAATVTNVYELGLFTDDDVLFAVAASSNLPLFTLHPDITFVASFGLSLADVAKDSVTVTTDSNGALSIALMQQHLASFDPHPQYLNQQRFLQFLELAYPYGYPYWTHSKSNPKPLFDAMFGYETYWRRLEGVGLVAVKDSDAYIDQPMLTLGQRGTTELATTERPHTYPIYTSYLFERYDPSTVVETVWKVAANKASINEGDAVRFTVTANNLPDGQILNWSAKEGALNSSSNDISSPDQTDNGTVILKNGQAIINFTTTSDDNAEEPQKHVRLVVGAPANLSINVPINDAGHHETVMHIGQSTTNGINLAEYFRAQSGSYPSVNETVRFIVDEGVDIIASDTATPAITEGTNWSSNNPPIVENHGRILGRGGDGGRSAYKRKFWGTDGDMLSTSKSLMRLPEKGGNGGTAVKSLTAAIVVENHNIVAGGGGGGGGLGAYKTGGSTGYVIGGGGTGGGAPFGQRSPNESTYTMYLQDAAVTDLKLPLPESGFYAILFQRVAGSVANASGSSADYNYPPEYTASDIEETRAINVEISATSTSSRAPSGFSKYKIAHTAGYALNNALQLKMSQSATLDSKGFGGSNLAASVTDSSSATTTPYPEGDDPTLTRGGDGGGFGESGQSGHFDKLYLYTGDQAVNASPSDMEWYIPSASGGLAGYIKEGSVTITNYSGGTTKGR